jgi:3-deoxy-manno-octulosonate cytidylyltransferase (CMP-KDO synthetase)
VPNAAPPFTVLIPARMASTRLPDKPLADIAGQPMVVRVAQRAKASSARRVVVAADSEAIVRACEAHGIEAVLTGAQHVSGSDRLAQACELLGLAGDDLVLNVQGDEPLIEPALIDSVACLLQSRPQASMSTAAHPIDSVGDFTNPNVVKVVLDAQGLALYFSRAPIAWWRDGFAGGIDALPQPRPLRHIGIYGYRAGFLREFPRLAPAPIEAAEALEQLRALWHGYRIAVHVAACAPGAGVDTLQDLERVRALWREPAA